MKNRPTERGKMWSLYGLTAVLLVICDPSLAQPEIPSKEVLDAIFPPAAAPKPILVKRANVGRTPADCDMNFSTIEVRQGDRSRTIELLADDVRSGAKGDTVLIRLSRLTVDADGAPRSYHPNDPDGKGVCRVRRQRLAGRNTLVGACALDQLSSAQVRMFEGTKRLSEKTASNSDSEFARAWERIWPLIKVKKISSINARALVPHAPSTNELFYSRDLNLTAVFDTAIIPFDSGYPCTDAQGYFVAATTYTYGRASVCSHEEYLDAGTIPFIVLPNLPGDPFGNVRVGDLVIVYVQKESSEQIVFGIFGDKGPHFEVGEGSIALNQSILGADHLIMNSRDLDKIDIDAEDAKILNLSVLVIGGSQPEDVSAEGLKLSGKRAFAIWAGADRQPLDRLRRCAGYAKTNPHDLKLSDTPR